MILYTCSTPVCCPLYDNVVKFSSKVCEGMEDILGMGHP